jgi:hypothetical protein
MAKATPRKKKNRRKHDSKTKKEKDAMYRNRKLHMPSAFTPEQRATLQPPVFLSGNSPQEIFYPALVRHFIQTNLATGDKKRSVGVSTSSQTSYLSKMLNRREMERVMSHIIDEIRSLMHLDADVAVDIHHTSTAGNRNESPWVLTYRNTGIGNYGTWHADQPGSVPITERQWSMVIVLEAKQAWFEWTNRTHMAQDEPTTNSNAVVISKTDATMMIFPATSVHRGVVLPGGFRSVVALEFSLPGNVSKEVYARYASA